MKNIKEAIASGTPVKPETLELIVRLTGRQTVLIHSVTKLIETADTNQRLMNIESLLDAISPEALREASQRLGR